MVVGQICEEAAARVPDCQASENSGEGQSQTHEKNLSFSSDRHLYRAF
jgi:hypothetical protein